MNIRLLLLLAACARDPQLGAERSPCRAGGICDPGLTCLSDRCVVVPDKRCADVTEALVSIELGNYAPVEDRAAKAAEIRPKCEAAHLGDAEAGCIIAARTRPQLALCPQPLLMAAAPPSKQAGRPPLTGLAGMPQACIDYVAVLDRYASCTGVPAEARAALVQVIAQLKQNWSGLGNNQMPQAVIDACNQGAAAIQQGMTSFGC
jgi:hypothetical protein